MNDEAASTSKHFIQQAIEEDLAAGRYSGVMTRFPPEPNGRLHIGHAKALAIDFGMADQFGGACNLRFDDTNPVKEETHYVDAIKEDIRWLGFTWAGEFYASDYFDQLYAWAEDLIQKGLAYVDAQSAEEVRLSRGTLTQPGVESPHRNRPADESLDLFRRMKAGEFAEGSHVLRARIDMASPNLNLRDPVMYRILHKPHHRTGDKWCLYPMYDWAHGQSDSIEGITHSLCSLEYEDHRPLYDWFLEALDIYRPRQIEFSRLNLNYTVMSKRLLRQLVEEGHVESWDDPRMPTLSGMRRRGYPPAAIRNFLAAVGVTKFNATTDLSLLEHHVREALNKSANRYLAVLNPIKVVLTNYPEDQVEQLSAVNNPEDPDAGSREIPFSRELYIDANDFMEDPPKKFFRLGPGREVRLRYGYIIRCDEVVKDDAGNLTELRCTCDMNTRSGMPEANRKVKATIHWVSAAHAKAVEVRLYDRLFKVENPAKAPEGGAFTDNINEASLEVLQARVEPALADLEPGTSVQFERVGYFCVDSVHGQPGAPVFNRTVALRDAWAKQQQNKGQPQPRKNKQK